MIVFSAKKSRLFLLFSFEVLANGRSRESSDAYSTKLARTRLYREGLVFGMRDMNVLRIGVCAARVGML